MLIDSEADLNVKVSGTNKDYCELLNKCLEYLQKLLFNFNRKTLCMLNKKRGFLQYKSGDLVYIISA